MINPVRQRIIGCLERITMFNRLISLALIVTVLGCPLWCSMGFCQCSGETTNLTGDVVDCCKSTCCGTTIEAEATPSQEPKEQGPKSERLRCQGICGGAVLESQCQIPASDLSHFLTCFDKGAPLRFSREHSVQKGTYLRSGIPEFPRADCRGRSLRICIMSFQC